MKHKKKKMKKFFKKFWKWFGSWICGFSVEFVCWIWNFGTKWLPTKIKLFNRAEAREIGEKFGGLEKLKEAYVELQREIYKN